MITVVPRPFPSLDPILLPSRLAPEREEFLRIYGQTILNCSSTERMRLHGELRGRDTHYFESQGALFLPFVQSNREAINQLVNAIGDSTAIITLERGGSLVLDHVNR